jgi:serine/threonine-protein kinase
MGEVYRARDTRLDRTVAIKVLPASLSADPSLRQRLEREARAISSLDHPHICGLYDIGLDGGHDYLVMQYLEGSTLASRLERGALPLAEAMKIGAQIAEALAAAHRRGIVHRDLKPGNVMLTASGAKLLDFGLAKSSAIREPMDPGRTMAALTAERTILGTLHYMAPEQVEGRDADSRSDIFALGAVLYEMLSGRRPFDGDSPASVIASILSTEPRPIADVAPLAPRSLDRVIARCLAKNPDDRWQSASDLAFELRAQADVRNRDVAPLASAAPRRRTAAWLAGAAVIALAGGAAGWLLKRQPPSTPRPVVRALLPLATGDELSYHDRTDFGQPVALSPDGRVVAYVMLGSPTKLVLRTVDTGESRVLVQAAAIGEVFFSPDSQFVGFVSGAGGADRPWTPGIGGSIRKISVSGGAATTVADGIGSIKGAWWGADGFIYYSPAPGMGLWRAPAAGGQGEKLTSPDRSQGEKTHRRPFLLPGNKSLLFVVGTSRIDSFDDARIEALRLSDRSRHRLIDGGTAPLYLASGHLLYARAGKLVAVPFDPERLAVEGAPMTVLEGVADQPASGVSNHAISADGTIVYLARSSDGSRGHVAISDRQGRVKRKYEAPVGTFTGREPLCHGSGRRHAAVDRPRFRAERQPAAHVRVGQLHADVDAGRLTHRVQVESRQRSAKPLLDRCRRWRYCGAPHHERPRAGTVLGCRPSVAVRRERSFDTDRHLGDVARHAQVRAADPDTGGRSLGQVLSRRTLAGVPVEQVRILGGLRSAVSLDRTDLAGVARWRRLSRVAARRRGTGLQARRHRRHGRLGLDIR